MHFKDFDIKSHSQSSILFFICLLAVALKNLIFEKILSIEMEMLFSTNIYFICDIPLTAINK